MLDLYKLHIFSTVVQEGSFSAAAGRLFMTQSGVSQHIRELESSLGRQLFQRGWRGVRLTSHGEILNQYAGEIFALVAKAEYALTDIEQLSSGRVSLGATPGIGIYLAPDWVQGFRARYPQLTVALQTGVTTEIVGEVLAGRLELGFVEGEPAEGQPRLASLVLDEIEQMVVVGSRHPFCAQQHVRLDDLRQQPLIVRQAKSQSRIWLERVLRQHDIEPVIGAEFDNLESMKRAVSVGQCAAVMPAYVVQAEVAQGLLHLLPLEGRPLTRSLKLVWDATAHFSPIASAFLGEMSTRYPALGPLLGQMNA